MGVLGESKALPERRIPYLCRRQELVRRCFCRQGSDCRCIKAFCNEPDAQRKLPQRDWECEHRRQRGHRSAWAEKCDGVGSNEQGRSDQSQQGKNPRHQARPIQEGAQQQGVQAKSWRILDGMKAITVMIKSTLSQRLAPSGRAFSKLLHGA